MEMISLSCAFDFHFLTLALAHPIQFAFVIHFFLCNCLEVVHHFPTAIVSEICGQLQSMVLSKSIQHSVKENFYVRPFTAVETQPNLFTFKYCSNVSNGWSNRRSVCLLSGCVSTM